MRTRPRLLPAALSLVVVLAAPHPVRAHGCHAAAVYAGRVPSPQEEIPGFPYRRALSPELNDYVSTVDAASPRVVSGDFGTSWKGTPLRYALVSLERNLRRLPAIVRDLERLRDPRATSRAEAARIAARTPAVVWYTANVHGNEMSGADAAVHLLHDFADRTDCEVADLLDRLVIGIMPTQNPDGRDAASRQNVYGFDMNRDWFAATQPETAGKLRLLERYPPVMLIDAHEMSSSNFFFPPNADPIHHEISPESLSWINRIYAPAIAAAFEERRERQPTEWDYFNYDIYDLFYMGYGDSASTTSFTAAGMTFEKGIADPDHQREAEQYVAGYTSIHEAALHKDRILREWYRAHATALAEGRRGALEPNLVLQPGNEVERRVPSLRVRHYFIGAGRAEPDVRRLVDRLARAGVEVYRLRGPLHVPALRPYGRPARAGTLPAGTYWIPMAQPQKRWIQALLGEDPYTPFPYFYDVTAWSNPLLMNLDAWFTADAVRPRADRVRSLVARGSVAASPRSAGPYWFAGDTGASVAAAFFLDRAGARVRRLDRAAAGLPRGSFLVQPGSAASLSEAADRFGVRPRRLTRPVTAGRPFEQPRLAVYRPAATVSDVGGAGTLAAGESLGHLRYLLDRVWRIPYELVTTPEIAAGALADGFDVLLVPGVDTTDLLPAAPSIAAWVERGGVYVGTGRPGATGGTPFAVMTGLTTASFDDAAGLQVPGTMFRVRVDGSSPMTLGAPGTAYWYHLGEEVLRASPASTPVSYPPERELWFSGYAEGEEVLQGSAGLVDDPLGEGRVVLFSGEPNFRAFTEGPALFLANAIASWTAPSPSGPDASDAAQAGAVTRARSSVPAQTGPGRPIRIEVAAADAARAVAALRDLGAVRPSVELARGSAFVVVANPRGLEPDRHPFSRRILPELRARGIEVRSAIL